MNNSDDNLGYWCARAVRERADAVAVVDLCRETPREITYGALDRRLDRVATALHAGGLQPGDRLALAIDNRIEFIEAMFGAMRAGIVPVPLNTRLGADALAYIVADAAPRAAVIEPAGNEAIAAVCEHAGVGWRIALDTAPAGWDDYETVLAAAPATFAPPAFGPDHPAFLPYTSGSTGRPKGVVLTHGGQMWWIRAVERYWPSDADDRALVAVPLYHKNAMAGAIKPMLRAGGSVVMLPGFEPRRFLETLAGYRCTQAGGVPTVFALMLRERDLIERLDFSTLKALKIGSAPVQPELVRAVEDAFGVPVGESYGLTEGGPVMLGPPLDGRRVPRGSCGVPWPEGEVKLIDGDGRENPRFGELWVRNPGVTPGYYNLPEVNAKRLRDGWLATGDLFSVDDGGFFYFRGRDDDAFKCGGETVYPKEVENLLLAHAQVADAAVAPLPHPTKGQAPAAMVVLAPGATIDADALKRHCLARGPAYAHPRHVLIVDRLPLSGAAKVDRAALARGLADAFPPQVAPPQAAPPQSAEVPS